MAINTIRVLKVGSLILTVTDVLLGGFKMTLSKNIKNKLMFLPITSFLVLLACTESETSSLNNNSSEQEQFVASNVQTTSSTINDKSIAVLPFSDLSPLRDQEYFSDGISAGLINTLSVIPDIQVAGRESSFYYKNSDVKLRDIGEALQVSKILLGTVRKSGNHLRITTQLVDALNGFNVWSHTFDSQLDEIFSIESEITQAVRTSLSVTLGAGEFDVPGMTRDIEAYDLLLQAQALYNEYTPETVFKAISLAEKAVEIDPGYGLAWFELGTMYDGSILILSAEQSIDFSSLSLYSFREAKKTAPDMPELLLVDAAIHTDNKDFLEAEHTYQRYFNNYGYSNSRSLEEYSLFLSKTGQMSAAIDLLTEAKHRDPLMTRFSYLRALYLLHTNQLVEARRETEFGNTLEGGKWLFDAMTWDISMQEGSPIEAAQHIEDYYYTEYDYEKPTISEDFMKQLARILRTNDFEASTEDIISLLTAPTLSPFEKGYLGRLIGLMHQDELALDYWLGQNISPALWSSLYSGMRELPGFKVLVQENGLVDYWRESGHWSDYCQPLGDDDFACH